MKLGELKVSGSFLGLFFTMKGLKGREAVE